MIKTVVKRNGKEVPFDLARIKTAIKKADSSTDAINISDRDIDLVTNMAVEYFEDNTKVSVEEIQDAVEDSLIAAGFTQTAKNYIRYRQTETDRRDAREKLDETYRQIFFGDAEDSDLRRDNANVNTDAPMGMMLKLGTEGSKSFLHNHVLPEKYSRMHKDGYVHIHKYNCGFVA